MLHPRPNSRTRQRHLRRDMRTELGTGRDSLPGPFQLLSVARSLGAALDNETDGRFGISVYDFKTNTSIPVGDAIQLMRDAEQAERERQELARSW